MTVRKVNINSHCNYREMSAVLRRMTPTFHTKSTSNTERVSAPRRNSGVRSFEWTSNPRHCRAVKLQHDRQVKPNMRKQQHCSRRRNIHRPCNVYPPSDCRKWLQWTLYGVPSIQAYGMLLAATRAPPSVRRMQRRLATRCSSIRRQNMLDARLCCPEVALVCRMVAP
jgi:hypothetical protein